MFTSIINSPQTSGPVTESFNIDFNERVKPLQQIFHLIPIIFRFFRKNLQSQQKVFNEYNDLSNTIQKVISIYAQYIHNRYDHENELLFLKDKISQIGCTQYCLKQYLTMIHSLEYETERLKILLNNPQFLQINQCKFPTYQQTQKIKLDRFIKENEKLKILINKQIDSIKIMQTQIKINLKELQRLNSILHNIKLEQKDVDNHWSQIKKQTSHFQTIFEKNNNMESEYNVKNEIIAEQTHSLTYRNQIQNLLHIKNQEYKITKIDIVLKKMIHLNNNFEKILQENRLIRIDEQEKLRSIKQISFQKRKQLITHTKHLHILSLNEHHLIDKIIRNSFEIFRLNNIFHDSSNTEKYFQSILQKKKTEMIKREKQRTSLNHYLHDNENQIDCLTKKNQLIENELQNKIDHFRLFNYKFLKQKHDQIVLLNQKQYCSYLYQQKLQNLNEIHNKFEQLEIISDHEINHIIKKNQENEQLKFNIQNIKQQIINMISRNKRQIDEYSLLNEKIRLYTQLNNINNQQQQRCSFHIKHFSYKILNLQGENNRLLNNFQNVQKKAMIITSSHHDNLLKKDNFYQILSQQPLIIRNSPTRIHIHKTLENYSTFVNRLMNIIHQCVQWQEKLAWINQVYFTKIEQIHQQKKLLSTKNEMILRYKINSEIKQYKAMKAELYLQSLV